MGKFNLTELLNARSKELAQEQQEQVEKVSGDQKQSSHPAGQIAYIDAYDLIPSKDNFYHVDDDLKRSIELVGVLQPLLVKRPQNGKYRVIAGHRRRLAVLALLNEGNEERRYVPCVFKDEDVRDRLALIMANRFRDKMDWEKMQEAIEAEELAKELKKEYGLKGRTRAVLEEIVGVSEAQLGRYKAIYNHLIPELMLEFKENRIGFSVAAEACGLPEDLQAKAAEKIENDGGLSLPDVRALKQEAEKPMKASAASEGEEAEEDNTENGIELDQSEPIPYKEPHPEEIVSICYQCVNYEDCHEKKSTVQRCDSYLSKAEAYKTEEQKYEEEQDRIDRETKRKLSDRNEETAYKSQTENQNTEDDQDHSIKIPPRRYEEITSGVLTFLLLKKQKFLKPRTGIILEEHRNGITTGRKIIAEIAYVWEDAGGLDDNYCIIGLANYKN